MMEADTVSETMLLVACGDFIALSCLQNYRFYEEKSSSLTVAAS
jgi:hypothetical protein